MKLFGILCLVLSVLSARAVTPSDAAAAFGAFNASFYKATNGLGHYKKDSERGHADFWMQAEEIEMIEDVWARTGSMESARLITESIDGFTNRFGADWSTNKFNDDLMWMTIACARGYLITSNAMFLDEARKHFRIVNDRAWDNTFGGGLYWSTDRNCKNSCINGPAAIAACLLYQITSEKSYLDGAKMIYAWERRVLFNPATGGVADNIQMDGRIARKVFTYNEGTFIGAANFLWKLTGDTNYFNDAQLAVGFTRDRLCTGGILPGYGSGDSAGFNGIFIRWLGRLAEDNHLWPQYYDWMARNAAAAWNARNADNLSWQKWKEPTPAGTLESWNCSGTVVLLHVLPPEPPGKAN